MGLTRLSDSKHLAEILAAIGDGVIATDHDGRIIYANAAAASIIGLPTADIIGKPFDEAVPLFDALTHKRLKGPVERCLKLREPVGLENRTEFITPDGEKKYLSANCAPIIAANDGKGAVVVFRDVTSYKILEQKNEDNESNLKRIFDAAPVGMLILGPGPKIVQVNYAALNIIGARKEQALNQFIGNAFCCKERLRDERGCGFGAECKNCDLRRSAMLASEGIAINGMECQKTFFRAGREWTVWLRTNFSPLAVDGDTHVLMTMVDISEQKKKEIAAIEARDFYLGIFENLPVAVWRVDTTGRINYTNQYWCLMTGQTPRQAAGCGWLEFIHPEDRERILGRPDRQSQTDILTEGEIRIRHASGEYRWLYCINRLYTDPQGVPEGFIGMGIDITERREAEEALGRYKVLSEKALDIFLFVDADGNILEANEAAIQAYGYTREEILTKTIFDLRGEKDTVKKQLGDGFRRGIYFETTHYRKNGSPFPVEVKAQGTVIGGREVLLSVIRDISQRKQAEEALRQSEEKFRLLFDKANDAVTLMEESDDDRAPGVFIEVNDAACAMLGYNREELIGMELAAIDKTLPRAELAALYKKTNSSGQMHLETVHTAKDGREIAVEVVGHRLEVDGKRLLLSAARDITERKRAAELLEASRAEYYSLFMNMPVGFAYVRVIFDGGENAVDFEYIEVNEAFPKMVGRQKEEIIGKNFRGLFPDLPREHIDRLAVYGEIALGKRDRADMEFFSHVAGKWVSMTLYSPAKGNVVALVTDITERRLALEALEQAKNEAEATYRAKSEFLVNMSHEIRTPINGINGMIELTLLTDLDFEQRDNLMTAKSCSQVLLGIINDILDFSKMEAGKLALETVNFNIRDFIEEVIKVHSQATLTKDIDLRHTMSANVPKFVAGDPLRLRQILYNLLSNAIKFTEHGHVTLAVKRVGTADDKKVELVFSVTDTGIGISEQERDKLFKSFSQVDGSITRRFGGTGLGLAISKRLVELMGGSIWVESEKGKGSTFAFSVCLTAATGNDADRTAETPARINPPTEKLSVLLVEDDKVSRLVVTKYLRQLGHQVECADNGRLALELYAGNHYDVVLMDIQMPDMDGVEATRRIREIGVASGRYTPIVAVTAHALSGDREKYLAAGLDEYIAKPVQIVELQEKLQRVTSLDMEILRIIAPPTTGAQASTIFEQAKIIDEIERLNGMAGSYADDAPLFEGLVHRIKGLANTAGLEDIKALAFKAELAARRAKMEEAVNYTTRIQKSVEIFRKTNILS
ncbi:PAS domain S-box protein [Anaeroselena agilis]|uniref:histidine kinase n=1 Tax=Anaeroselena agilis TaxID=3063788 RepID=A0ABU3NV36_9FIRM|nr:PAS domain S-box protein [Selenomonadales bacterium 4137-cl]